MKKFNYDVIEEALKMCDYLDGQPINLLNCKIINAFGECRVNNIDYQIQIVLEPEDHHKIPEDKITIRKTIEE